MAGRGRTRSPRRCRGYLVPRPASGLPRVRGGSGGKTCRHEWRHGTPGGVRHAGVRGRVRHRADPGVCWKRHCGRTFVSCLADGGGAIGVGGSWWVAGRSLISFLGVALGPLGCQSRPQVSLSPALRNIGGPLLLLLLCNTLSRWELGRAQLRFAVLRLDPVALRLVAGQAWRPAPPEADGGSGSWLVPARIGGGAWAGTYLLRPGGDRGRRRLCFPRRLGLCGIFSLRGGFLSSTRRRGRSGG